MAGALAGENKGRQVGSLVLSLQGLHLDLPGQLQLSITMPHPRFYFQKVYSTCFEKKQLFSFLSWKSDRFMLSMGNWLRNNQMIKWKMFWAFIGEVNQSSLAAYVVGNFQSTFGTPNSPVQGLQMFLPTCVCYWQFSEYSSSSHSLSTDLFTLPVHPDSRGATV